MSKLTYCTVCNSFHSPPCQDDKEAYFLVTEIKKDYSNIDDVLDELEDKLGIIEREIIVKRITNEFELIRVYYTTGNFVAVGLYLKYDNEYWEIGYHDCVITLTPDDLREIRRGEKKIIPDEVIEKDKVKEFFFLDLLGYPFKEKIE